MRPSFAWQSRELPRVPQFLRSFAFRAITGLSLLARPASRLVAIQRVRSGPPSRSGDRHPNQCNRARRQSGRSDDPHRLRRWHGPGHSHPRNLRDARVRRGLSSCASRQSGCQESGFPRERSNGLSTNTGTRPHGSNYRRQPVVAGAGNAPYALITAADVERGRDRRAATPHQARHFLDAMRGLLRWAYRAKLIKGDPTAGCRNPGASKEPGFQGVDRRRRFDL